MKRSGVALEDASDRAHKHRKIGNLRIPVDQLGFLPDNRGGMGILPYHVHEVAWDCLANKTKLSRYQQVDVVKLPHGKLQEVLEANRNKCEASTLMPPFSPAIQYACLTKTHFVHAHKLGRDGTRTLFHEGKVRIRWQLADEEAAVINEQGVLCAVYDSALLDDVDALRSVMGDDNLNASVQMAEDEMQAFGRVDRIFEKLVPSQQGQTIDTAEVIDSLRASGLGSFPEDVWMHFIQLRAKLPPGVSQVFRTCQFHSSAGRVRVKPSDFGLAAKLDRRGPWSKIAVLMLQYLPFAKNAQAGPSGPSNVTFGGRAESTAKKLNIACMKQLEIEPDFVVSMDQFIKDVIKHYPVPIGHGDPEKVLDARTLLLAESGRFLLKVGAQLADAVQKAVARQQEVSDEWRRALVADSRTGKLDRIESQFRDMLVASGAFTNTSLPGAIHRDAGHPNAQLQAKQEASNQPASLLRVALAEADCGELIDADFFERLGVQGLGGEVMIRMPVEDGRGEAAPPVMKLEQLEESKAPNAATLAQLHAAILKESAAEVTGSAAPSQQGPLLARGKLVSLQLPEAKVAVQTSSSVVLEVTVSASDLLPVRAAAAKISPRQVTEPVLMLACEAAERMQNYDFEQCKASFFRSLATYALNWIHLPTQLSTCGVSVYLMSNKGKLPYKLQVRADCDFKKGELVLAPFGGDLHASDEPDALKIRADPNVLHHSMLSHTFLKVRASSKGSQPTSESYVIGSPLLGGKQLKKRDSCLQNIAPFWALCRCVGARADHNMELEDSVFHDQGLLSKTGKYPKLPGTSHFHVETQTMRNSKKISRGEVLALQFDVAGDD